LTHRIQHSCGLQRGWLETQIAHRERPRYNLSVMPAICHAGYVALGSITTPMKACSRQRGAHGRKAAINALYGICRGLGGQGMPLVVLRSGLVVAVVGVSLPLFLFPEAAPLSLALG
jgi:hypothetical protein